MSNRLIPITNLTQGMRSDDTSPGTLREALDVLPWRGALRRRGPITEHLSFNAPTALNADQLAVAASGSTLRLGANSFYSVPTTANGADYFAGGSVDSISTGNIRTSRCFEANGELIILPDLSAQLSAVPVRVWDGAPASTTTYTGTVTVTAGSKHAAFSVGVAEGVATAGYLTVNGNTYRVEKAVSTTAVSLAEPARVSYSGSTWSMTPVTTYHVSNAAASTGLFGQANGGSVGSASLLNQASAQAGTFHQGRVVFGNIREYVWSGTGAGLTDFTDTIRWSALPAEADANNFQGGRYFHGSAKMRLGGAGGAIMGLHSHEGNLFVLRERAVQVVTGGLSTTGVDLGASVNTIATNIGCRSPHAWAEFERGVVFADENGCYLWDGEGVANLTQGVVEIAWRNQFSSTDRLQVSCVGGRIIVMSGTTGFVFDLSLKSWYRIRFEHEYSRVVESVGKYVAMRSGAVEISSIRSYNFRTVFEDLNSDATGRSLDADGSGIQGTEHPRPYILTNPIPLVNGFSEARVLEIILNDGGEFDEAPCTLRLLRGAIYSGDAYSGEDDLADMSLGEAVTVIPLDGGDVEPTVNQRSIRVRMDGSRAASHAMVELNIQPTSGSSRFAWALNAIGLILEDNPNYESA